MFRFVEISMFRFVEISIS
ncbi:unnamed protein product, partial [Rotaria magnacalcarata]